LEWFRILRVPTQAGGRIQAENDGTVHKMRTDMPKVWHELRGFTEVHATKRRLATVTVNVNVEHTDFVAEGDLHGFSYRRGTDHCAHRAITEVVAVGHLVEIVCKHDPT
jgi:hypothetical protein